MLDGLSHSTWALTTAHLAGRRRRLSASLFQETAHQLENIPSAGRLHQNAVEAGFIRPLLHFVLRPAGHGHEHRVLPRRPGANLLASVEAVETGHADVEQHRVGIETLDNFNGAPAVRRGFDLVS